MRGKVVSQAHRDLILPEPRDYAEVCGADGRGAPAGVPGPASSAATPSIEASATSWPDRAADNA